MNRQKINIILGFFLLNAFQSYSQSTATISGTVENQNAASIQVSVDRLYLNKKIETLTGALNNGQFNITVTLEGSRLVEIAADYFHSKIFLEPNDNLQVEVKYSSVSLSGTGSVQNTFLKTFFAQFKNDFDDSLMHDKMLNIGVDAFEISVYNSRKKQNEFYKNAAAQNKFSSGFAAFMENIITYRYWDMLLSYPIINANSNKGMTVNELPAVMLDGFEKVKVNNDAALNCEPYREFLKYYVTYFTSEKNGFKKFTDLSVSADKKSALAKERLKDSAYRFWLAQFLTEECGRLSPFITKKLFADLKAVDRQGSYTSLANEICGEKLAMKEEKKKSDKTIEEPEPAFTIHDELDLTDVKGKHVALSDFKGKVVYIDFWASWCGPCRGQMPYSKQLHAKLSDKQKKKIIFLYISIDVDPARWKKAMEELGIEGVSVNSPGNWSSKVCSYFQINSIPRYMIMDKKGNIVDYNAKRPGDPMVFDDLIKYADE